jgi:hypothetical protein
MTRRRVGWLSIVAGAGLALAVQVLAPVGVPLYDGVAVQEPYRYLNPAGGQPGDPASGSDADDIVGGVSPEIVAATTEQPPQAQLIAQRGAFEVPVGATSVMTSVTPVDPPAPPPEGVIIGNVYRFSVTDEAGNPLVPKPCDGCRSLVLRAPEDAGDAQVMRFGGGAWSEVTTLHALGQYQVNPDALGDYALIAAPGSADAPPDLSLIVLGGGIALAIVAILGLLLIRGRSPSPPPAMSRPGRPGAAGRGTPPGRVPSKRRGPRRPPSGRSGG